MTYCTENSQDARVVVDALLTVRDLEDLLKIDKRTITRLCNRGLLPQPLKLGGGNRWRAREIADVIDRLEQRIGKRIEPATV